MNGISFAGRRARQALAASLLLLCALDAFAADTYVGGVLTMPALVIGNASFSNVVVDVGGIVSGPSGTAAKGAVDSYDPVTGHLTVQSVVYAGKTYHNVVATVKNLVSIGSVTGADTYANGALSVPFVRLLGGALYAQASVTSLVIDSVGGGMPQYVQDVFDPASRHLTIAAVQYNGKVYTNVVVTVQSATVGAYGTVVPDVVGDTETAAVTALNAAVIGVSGVTLQASTTVASGNVISQSPAAGTEVIEGSTVSLVVSSGAESLVYSFAAQSGNTGGWYPGALIQGTDGNLYGMAQTGGAANNGTLYKLTLAGAESVVYSFPHPTTSGNYIPDGLVQGSDGNFYGTTRGGGTYGGGTLVQVTPGGTATTVYTFCGCLDNLGYFEGEAPNGLIRGSDGSYYGTAQGGQDSSGVLFRIPVPGAGLGQVLYTFGSSAHDGQTPVGNLVLGSDGNFYGTTAHGGLNGTGTVFRVTPSGTETVLYPFGAPGSTDPQVPVGGLVEAADGNFYGLSYGGGTNNTGTVFRVTPGGVATVLYSFGAPVNSQNPTPTVLIQASDGNFYGGTQFGGSFNIGMIFRMTPSGAVTVVHSFSAGGTDGAYPSALIQASDGNLYGSALSGGANGTGAVFKVLL